MEMLGSSLILLIMTAVYVAIVAITTKLLTIQ